MGKFLFLCTKCFFFIFSWALLGVKTEGKLNEHTKDSRAIQIKLEIMYSESLSFVYISAKEILLIDWSRCLGSIRNVQAYLIRTAGNKSGS